MPPVSPDPQTRPTAKTTRVYSYVAPRRETVTTIREDGSHRSIHPADVKGRFTQARRNSALVLVGVYLLLPWMQVGGHPAVFLDLSTRRFHLFGWTLAAQDLWLTFFLISGVGFSLFLLTSLLGRVWCGWACPQTVFLEHFFRRIERLIDGDARQRRALEEAPWTAEKVLRRGTKHVVFFLLSAAIAHLLLAYFVSIPELWQMIQADPGEHWSAFLFVFGLTVALYFNFAWFREQLCIVLCPYGRMQSALIDEQSLVIGYDAKRGEPRGKVGLPDAGACVDCNRCVQVCPTGIDIRQGLQMECIGCAACIDVCDQVMTKLKRPHGLIRYDSNEGFAGRRTRWLRPRIFIYAFLLILGVTVFSSALLRLHSADVSVTRLRGAPYFVDADYVRNQFMVRLVNKTDQTGHFLLRAQLPSSDIVVSGLEKTLDVPPLGEELRTFIVQVPRAAYKGGFTFSLQTIDAPQTFTVEREAEFVGPDPELLNDDPALRARSQ